MSPYAYCTRGKTLMDGVHCAWCLEHIEFCGATCWTARWWYRGCRRRFNMLSDRYLDLLRQHRQSLREVKIVREKQSVFIPPPTSEVHPECVSVGQSSHPSPFVPFLKGWTLVIWKCIKKPYIWQLQDGPHPPPLIRRYTANAVPSVNVYPSNSYFILVCILAGWNQK